MKTRALILVGLLFTLSLTAGNEKGGAGIAENNILFAYWNLESYLSLCQASAGCQLTDAESKTVTRIKANLAEERKTKDQIIFKSEAKEPGLFLIEGLVRIAKTGYHVGDVIYVNSDLLYPPVTVNMVGVPPYGRPFDLPYAVSLLVHELGHHLGIKDHTSLDLLGSKVQTLMRTNTQEVDGGPEERQLIATAINFGGISFPDLIVRDEQNLHSLTAQLKDELKCPAAKGPVGGFWIWNLHWGTYRFKGPNHFIRPLRARVQIYCGAAPHGESLASEFEIELAAARTKEGALLWKNGPFPLRQSAFRK